MHDRKTPFPAEPNDHSGRNPTMQFILTGFTQDAAFRVFEFDYVGSSQPRTQFTVRADLDLTRRYGIRVQELPLLCRGVLETRGESEEARAFTLTEEKMMVYMKDGAAAKELAAQKKKPRKPMAENLGAAWRGSRPL
jgi:hypothetical protein